MSTLPFRQVMNSPLPDLASAGISGHPNDIKIVPCGDDSPLATGADWLMAVVNFVFGPWGFVIADFGGKARPMTVSCG